MAIAAGDVAFGLHQRMEADEPLTPEFLELILTWARRTYVHDIAAARSTAQRLAAADVYWRSASEPYGLQSCTYFEGETPVSVPIAEYGVRQAQQALAKAGIHPAATAEGVPVGLRRSQLETGRVVWEMLQKRVNAGEPLTPEFDDIMASASRRLCFEEMAAASNSDQRLAAARAHVERLQDFHSAAERVTHSTDGPISHDDLAYRVLEAKLSTARLSPSMPGRFPPQVLKSGMAIAAIRYCDFLWRRYETGAEPTIEFVEQLCQWSRRADRSGELRGHPPEMPPSAVEHLRRMRDLHADLKKRFDDDRDVSRIQVSQAAYFLREAELDAAEEARDQSTAVSPP
jgi:hypothetical protein